MRSKYDVVEFQQPIVGRRWFAFQNVQASGRIKDPLTGRLRPGPAALGGGRGLWVANQVCDLVEIRTGLGGTQIRLHMRLPA